MTKFVPEMGDAEEGCGPLQDDHVVRVDERGTSHYDQSMYAMR